MAKTNSTEKHGHRFIDLTGQVFGRLNVVEFCGMDVHHNSTWRCRCSCGNEIVTRGADIKNGRIESCKCLRAENHIIHGHAKHGEMTPEYRAFHDAKKRCTDPRRHNYSSYGGRGIKFLFVSFEEFIAEIGKRPTSKHSMDRIDVNGHYERGNIRWATAQEQANNKRATHRS